MKPAPSKIELRLQMRSWLKSITPAERARASAEACRRLREQAPWKAARSILVYAPLPGELDLRPAVVEALAEGKIVTLPRFQPKTGAYEVCQIDHLERDCASGKFGIAEPHAQCEPFPLKHLDFVLVPGLGFDLSGHRLGRGRGYYDKLLAGLTAAKCGVAWDGQVLARLPGEAHDVRMNLILTPTQWLVVPG